MLKRFIERPVLSTVISIIIVILGILGIESLPVSQYPEIAPPTVRVIASYTGASAEVVLKSVVVPLEEAINGVENMTYITSTASNQGTAIINVYFEQGTNPDIAAVNVQNRVASANSLLPSEVIQAGVTTRKQQTDNILILSLYSEDETYDASFVQSYAEINLLPALKRVKGVGDARALGLSTYSMRIWLRPDVMASYGLVPADVIAALQQQNIEAAPGQFGLSGNQAFQYIIKYTGKLTTEDQFSNIIIRSDEKGQLLRLSDVAQIELGSLSYDGFFLTNGQPGIGITVNQTSGSNAQEVIKNSLKVLEDAAESFPAGLNYKVMVNANQFLDASIESVIRTLIEAFILVFIVVFIFLQDFRSTLIPAIAVPVAIIGTFFFLNLFGFSINLLTLFALVLAIGIVVDDAIVVVEAVHAKLETDRSSPKQASIDTMHEISGAIISITLVMSAVFIPVAFIQGSSGVFYRQFGITLAVAIIISAINALTLSPALCALFLKPYSEKYSNTGFLNRFYFAFNASFKFGTMRYRKVLSFLTKKKWITVFTILIASILLFLLMKYTPRGFVPNEDLGSCFIDISLAPASSLERTNAIAAHIDSIVTSIPEAEATLRMAGFSIINGQGSSYGMIILRLNPWDERDRDVNEIIAELRQKLSSVTSANINIFAPPTLRGFGMGNGFEFQIQDKTGGDIENLATVSQEFIGKLNARPEIQYAATSFKTTFPQYVLNVNVAKAAEAGISVENLMFTMQGYFGGIYASNFNRFGKQFRVMVQADADYRKNIEDLKKIFVKTANNEMAPITEFINLERTYGPESLSRFNLYTAVSVTGVPSFGYGSSDALSIIDELTETLPAGYDIAYSGISREETKAGSQTGYIFMLCVVFVYFLLCAQYESYIIPFSVILSLPIGLSGSFIFAYIFNVTNNIYMQISLIMLIGLLAKNAILIVEFAIQRRRAGMDIVKAAIEAATIRLRPILMTSFALIFGLLPLMLSSGVGANGNRSIGTGVIGGMFVGTIFGILFIPILFIIFETLQEKISGPPFSDDDTVQSIEKQ